MSTAGRVAKNTLFLYAKMGITMFISLYTTRLILQALGAEDFGIFSIVGGAIAMLGFLNAAMASATQRFMSYSEGEGDKEKQKRIFNISFVLHTAIGLLMGLVLTATGWLFFHGILNISPARVEAAQVVYGSLIVSTVFTVMSVPYEAVLNARENMLYYSIVGVIESLLKLAVALLVVRTTGDKLIWYGILMAGIPLVTLTIMRIYCHAKYEECVIAPRKYWDKGLMKEMRSFAGWNLMGSLSSMISSNGMGVMINIFHGTVANAAQGIANQVSGQLGVLGGAVKKSISPILTKSVGASDFELMVSSAKWGTKIIFFLVTLLFLPLIIETDYILSLWLGGSKPSNVSIFCRLLLIVNLIDDLVLFLPTIINAFGKIKVFQLTMSIIGFFPLLLGFIFFSIGSPPYFMYLAMIISSILKSVLLIYFAKVLCKLDYIDYLKSVVIKCMIVFIGSLSIGFIPTLFWSESVFRLMLSTSVSYGILIFFILVLGLDLHEKRIVTHYFMLVKGKFMGTKKNISYEKR